METKKKLKTCKNGHRFFKSSNCPTCPICEEERKPKDSFMALLSAPARRALESVNIETLEDLTNWNENEIIKLHGIGPSSIPKLKKALSENNLSFKAL